MAGQVKSSEDRDLRLDFFRGLALWFIFVAHHPSVSGESLLTSGSGVWFKASAHF
jgi:hypothetical protein